MSKYRKGVSKMKVMQVIPEFSIGGAEIMCENLTIALKQKGVDVIVVSLYNYHSSITDRLEDNNIQVIYLNKKKGLDIDLVFKLVKIFKDEKPDVIHTHLYSLKYAFLAAKFSRIKVLVHTLHNVAKKESRSFNRKINKVLFKYCNVVPVALSNNVKETILEEYDLSNDVIPVVYNGIDLSKCKKKKIFDLNNPIKIIHVGRFSKQKNHNWIIKEFYTFHKIFEKSELILVGEGELQNSIKKLVEEMNLKNNVSFLGAREDIYYLLNDADIFILPSLYEGIPMTIIEAMGTGMPIVATNVGGVPDMIEDKQNGILIQNKDGELVKALIELVENEKLRIKISQNAYLKSNVFSNSNMAQNYIDIYRNQK